LNEEVSLDLSKYAPNNLDIKCIYTVFGNTSAVSTEIDIFRNLNLYLRNEPSANYLSNFLYATKSTDGQTKSSLSLIKLKPPIYTPPGSDIDGEEYFLSFPGTDYTNEQSIGFLIKDDVNYREIIKAVVCGSGHSMFTTVPLYYVDRDVKHYEPVTSY
jgi:hypothetical protein